MLIFEGDWNGGAFPELAGLLEGVTATGDGGFMDVEELSWLETREEVEETESGDEAEKEFTEEVNPDDETGSLDDSMSDIVFGVDTETSVFPIVPAVMLKNKDTEKSIKMSLRERDLFIKPPVW